MLTEARAQEVATDRPSRFKSEVRVEKKTAAEWLAVMREGFVSML